MDNALYVEQFLIDHGIDILGICEHWLYPTSLGFLDTLSIDYTAFAKADRCENPYSNWHRGKGGVALLWKSSIGERITRLAVDNERVIGIKYATPRRSWFVFMVYAPSCNHGVESFKDFLDELVDLYNQYSVLGTVIIMGDLNAEISGPRHKARTFARENYLLKVTRDCNLMSCTVQDMCTGPAFTFSSGGNSSLIDHILIPLDDLDLLQSCEVLTYSVHNKHHNSSDHLPVAATINTTADATPTGLPRQQPRLRWDRAEQEQLAAYSGCLAHLLNGVTAPSMDSCSDESIDTYLETLYSCMHHAAAITIPHSAFSSSLKPHWKSAGSLHSNMRSERRAWISAGRPRGPLSPTYVSYKAAKRDFRRVNRKGKLETDLASVDEIDHLADMGRKEFWEALRKRKRAQNNGGKQCDAMMFNGVTVRDPTDIANGWANYFEKLYAPSEDSEFDEVHRARTENLYNSYLQESHKNTDSSLDGEISTHELLAAIKSLKKSKAGGLDGLVNEHFKYGGAALHNHLRALLNLMHNREYIPVCLKTGKVCTLLKDPLKPSSDPNNYRGITLLPVLLKLYERIILSRLEAWVAEHQLDFPDCLQNAYRKGTSSLNVSFCLQEAIQYNMERGSKTYVCFIDSSKAFDVVWHQGLFVKLYELGVRGKLWRIILTMYTQMTSCVAFNGIVSRTFPVRQSVRQGGVLSPWLYLLYIDALIKEVRRCGLGARVIDVFVGILVQADDIALLALTPADLQTMIKTAYSYSCKWRYKLNIIKTKVMVFGETKRVQAKLQPKRKWKLGVGYIEETTEYKHVGVILNSQLDVSVRTTAACKKGKKSFMSLQGYGVGLKSLNPLTSTKLYKQIVIPSMLYGCELWGSVSASHLLTVERAQRFCVKFLQGLRRTTRTDMCLSLIGLPRLSAFIDRCKLNFLRLLCVQHDSAISKQVFLRRVSQLMDFPGLFLVDSKSPVADFKTVLLRYNLFDCLPQFSESGIFPGKTAWKLQCTNAIVESEELAFIERTSEDPDFDRFREVHSDCFSPSISWHTAKLIPHSLRLFRHLICVLTSPDTLVSSSLVLCEHCGALFRDYLVHYVAVCPKFNEQRDQFWNFVTNNFSVQLSAGLFNLEDDQLVNILLGAPCHIAELADPDIHTIFHYRCARWVNSIRALPIR